MYNEYYGLTSDPFRIADDQANFYPSKSTSKARSYLQYGLQANDGIVLVTGASGTGKTTLVQHSIKNQALGIQLRPIVLDCLDCTARELLSHFSLMLTGKGISTESQIPEILSHIKATLVQIKATKKTVVLILDDAHHLNANNLVAVKHLSDLRANGENLLQLHLVGLPSLRETILGPGLEYIHNRLVATCRVVPLTELETTEYIVRNLTAAGWRGSPEISADVCKVIYIASMGIRRWINLCGSRLLLHGMANQKTRLDLSDACGVLQELLNEELLPNQVRTDDQLNRKLSATFLEKTA